MKVTIAAQIHAEQDSVYENHELRHFTVFKAWPIKLNSTEHVFVCEHRFEIEIPDFDMRASIVASLEAKKQEVAAEYQKRVTELNAQIQSLLAIEA